MLLDAGCGIGSNLNSILKKYPKAKIIGIDNYQPDLEIAQKFFLNLMFEQNSENNSTLLMVSHDNSLSNQFDRLIDINEILIREDKSCY